MDTKYLRTVKAIRETGSFQKAAALLNYAPSTITFQVQQAEAQLGVALFARVGRQMVLTEAGNAVMPMIDQILTDAEALERFTGEENSLAGRLVVAVPETLLTYELQGVLKAFKSQAPGVELVIRVLNCYEIYRQLVDGQVDFAIHYDVRAYPKAIHTQILKSYSLSLVASPELANEDFVTAGQEKSVCALMNDPHARYLEIFRAYLAEKRIHLKPNLELWSIEAIKNCAISGLGVAYLPTFCAKQELAAGRLVAIETPLNEEQLTAIVAYQHETPAGQLFKNLLISNLSKSDSVPE